MNRTPDSAGVRRILGEGWGLFVSRFTSVFPWIVAAELTALLPFANPPGSIFTTDMSLYGQPDYLIRALVFGAAQALFYSIAVLRLDKPGGPAMWREGLRATPSVLVGYICYLVIIGIGLVFTAIFFVIGAFIIGPLGGLVLCILPLAPTAAVSTAMALFIFPAVLERKGPFASLRESSRLAKTSWVKVSLVISVPAIALLAAAVVGDIPGIRHAVTLALDLRQRAAEGGLSTDQLLQVLDGLKPSAAADRYGAWTVAGVLLGALAWWYTLAICYVQYRDLKAADKT